MSSTSRAHIGSFALLLAVAVLPLLLGAGYALLYSFGIVGVLNHGFTLEHWKALFSTNEVWLSFAYSAWLSAVSLSACVLVSMIIALKYHRYFRKGFFSYLIYQPLAFPSLVAAFFFFQFLSNAGVLARLLYQMGLIQSAAQFPNLVNDPYSIGILAAQFFISCPIFILLYTNLIQTERIADYLQLSATLGAGRIQSSWRIAIPVLLRKSAPTILLYFIFKLGAYEIPLLLGRSSPETISVFAVRKLQKFNLNDIPQGYAVAILYMAVVLLLLIVALKKTKASHEI